MDPIMKDSCCEEETEKVDRVEAEVIQEVNHLEDEQREALAKKAIMEVACASALTGVSLKHGGPFGACVVRNGIFISVAHNTVLLNGDPTCHAEMEAIRKAAAYLKTDDLSDCELYTTAESCSMCYGAIHWSKISKVYVGVDRHIAAKFGFDDKVFYEQVEQHWAIKVGQTDPNAQPSMLNMYCGIEKDLITNVLSDLHLNTTFRRRGLHIVDNGEHFGEDVREKENSDEGSDSDENGPVPEKAKMYMEMLEKEIRKAARVGKNKQREIFASLIVDENGEVISIAVNEVLATNDPTATSEINAIRRACEKKGTHNLAGCTMYSTIEPDLMSLSSILWSRISDLYYGLSQNKAAKYGHDDALLHYRCLCDDPEIVKKIMSVETGVAHEKCEDVFKEWSKINAVIY